MSRTMFVGQFETSCSGYSERTAKKDLKTMNSKLAKYINGSLVDGDKFCFSCLSPETGLLLVEKLEHMADKGFFRCSFGYSLVDDVEGGMASLLREYKKNRHLDPPSHSDIQHLDEEVSVSEMKELFGILRESNPEQYSLEHNKKIAIDKFRETGQHHSVSQLCSEINPLMAVNPISDVEELEMHGYYELWNTKELDNQT